VRTAHPPRPATFAPPSPALPPPWGEGRVCVERWLLIHPQRVGYAVSPGGNVQIACRCSGSRTNALLVRPACRAGRGTESGLPMQVPLDKRDLPARQRRIMLPSRFRARHDRNSGRRRSSTTVKKNDPPGTQARLSLGIAILSSDGPVSDVRFTCHLPETFLSGNSRDLRFRALHVQRRSCLHHLPRYDFLRFRRRDVCGCMTYLASGSPS
jgi:hypothetical protein